LNDYESDSASNNALPHLRRGGRNPDRGAETILLVEDARTLRPLVRELLEQQGYQVLEAGDPLEALALSENHNGEIHLLLTDVMMPELDGVELAKRLRKRRTALRVVYMSGYSGAGLRSMDQDGNFLEKPFKPDALAALVRKVLDAA
jgi:CheY-like chemotaxis protein